MLVKIGQVPWQQSSQANSSFLGLLELELKLKSYGRWRFLCRGQTGRKRPGSWLPRSRRIARRARAPALVVALLPQEL